MSESKLLVGPKVSSLRIKRRESVHTRELYLVVVLILSPLHLRNSEAYICWVLYDFEFQTGKEYYITFDDMYYQMISTYRQLNPADVVLELHEENKLRKILSKYKRYGWFDHVQ